MLPPPMDGSSVTDSVPLVIRDSLRAATARALAREARAAFEAADLILFEGAIQALVELASCLDSRRCRS